VITYSRPSCEKPPYFVFNPPGFGCIVSLLDPAKS